jgi:predicted GIY-YIG superfamily endonuclease
MQKGNYCYLLESNKRNRSYVGASKNIIKRLRQHNGEIKGGAKYCRSGRPWKMIVYVKGFIEYKQALQFEWSWKYETRKISRSGKTSIERRIIALNNLLIKKRWTRNSPLSEEIPLTVYLLYPINDLINIPNHINIINKY